MFHAQAVQQSDQPGPGLVFDAALSCNPRTNRAGRAWQRRGDPGFQLVLLLGRQPAGGSFMAKARQTLDPVFLIQLIPSPDRVVVEQQHLGNRLTAHAVVQQHQRVGAPRQAVRSRAIARQLNQVAARFAVQEASAHHPSSRIASRSVGKQFSGFPQSQGIAPWKEARSRAEGAPSR